MSKTNKPPISISKLAKLMSGKEDKIAVIVGTVMDVSLYEQMIFCYFNICCDRLVILPAKGKSIPLFLTLFTNHNIAFV
ncbi:60S ribosomal protein L18-2 [Acorus gramineus]|uniref:60S ribosomal protein L18-2 n=1 Tax=Acorus gramineus TaxID=55184 RepID=A0AAV9B3B2_ACOGR|nr:60S ribosomal protein L18-2 [Acorus gramineus]